MRVPGLSGHHHGVELDEQFSHAGHESDFGWFACLPLLEHGITVPVGPAHLKRQIPSILEDAENLLSPRMRMLLLELRQEWNKLEEQMHASNEELAQFANKEDGCRRLLTIPGIGPLTATALVAAIGNGTALHKSRDLAA